MPKFRVTPQGPVWESLARETEALASLVRAGEVDMNRLGKQLAAVVGMVADAFDAADLASVRLTCAKKSLDLKTPKSELERFARDA